MSIASNNLFSKDGFFWWFGVVEDRQDPLKLGRCRVRIIGYHNDDPGVQPIDDLPWAYPMQGITSAAISGKGDAPLGPLEGTWIIGFFADGKDMQQPIMMGTIGGLPLQSASCSSRQKAQAEIAGVQRDANGNVVRDENGNAIQTKSLPTLPESTASKAINKTLPPLSQQQIQSLMDYIGNAESSSTPGGAQNYSITNSSGFLGKYQIGAQALQTLGYLKSPTPPRTKWTNAELDDPAIWSGKGGVSSKEEFLANKNNVQENAMFNLVDFNYKWATKNGLITSDSEPGRVGGILSAAHVELAAARDIANGHDKAVGGTTASYRYQIGAKAVGGDTGLPIPDATMASRSSGLNIPPTNSAAGPLNNPKLGHPDAFGDPNGVYPKCSYTSRQDTNKLATNNDDLQDTVKTEKEKNRVENVETANGASGGGWAEPESAYAAKYPYNKVKETESGHVIEMDDTPNAERIHIYHKSGTFVEIDREGSVSMKVKGENYEIFNRNNRMYIKGNFDTTIDGAKSLLVKNTLDVEIYGKTTVNIKDSAEVNISKDANISVGGNANMGVTGDLKVKAQNITMEAKTDFNITAGNYINVKAGGDLNYTVAGDEQHRVYGSFDLDSLVVNINSGTSNPFAGLASGLNVNVASPLNIIKDGFSATGLNPLPIDIANPLNSISKSLSNVLTGFGSVLGGLNSAQNLANLIGGGGLGSVLNSLGVNGLSNILTQSGFPSVQTIMDNAGLGGINIQNALNIGGFSNLNSIISELGGGSLENVLQSAGVDFKAALGNIPGGLQSEILNTLTNNGILDTTALAKGEALLATFVRNGATNLDLSIPNVVNSVMTNATEFQSWNYFPDTAQLSKYFTLGDLTSRVMDQNFQFPLADQAGMTKYDIITNLKSLSVNVLDVVNSKYPNMVVTDAFRPIASQLAQVTDNNPVANMLSVLGGGEISTDAANHINSVNPFNEGKAANIQFAGAKHEDYYNIAKWMKHNLAYDQIRLEYSTFGSGMPWITVVHNPEGNRDVQAPDKVVTCLNGKVVANYLVDLTSV